MGTCLPTDLFANMDTRIVNIAARKISGLTRTARIESLHFLSGTWTYPNLYTQQCANLLDSCLGATNSAIQTRLERELCRYLEVDTLETTYTYIDLPIEAVRELSLTATPPWVWGSTVWICPQYQEQRKRDLFPHVTSSYTPHAEEMNRSSSQRLTVFRFEKTLTWMDVALQILPYLGWAPECATERAVDIERVLRPTETGRRFFPGQYLREIGVNKPRTGRRRARDPELSVYTGVAILENIGAAACVVLHNDRVERRNLYIRGLVLPGEQPAYLCEVSVLHALRTLNDWLQNRCEA